MRDTDLSHDNFILKYLINNNNNSGSPPHTNRKVCHSRNMKELTRAFILVSRLARKLIMMMMVVVEVVVELSRYW